MSIKPRNRKATVVAGAMVTVALMTTAAACDGQGKASQPFNDAPHTARMDDTPAQIVEMPDGFNNFAWKCIQPGEVAAVTYHGDGSYGTVTVSPDAACK